MILIIKHIAIEGPGIIADYLANTAWQVKIVELGRDERLPHDLSDIEAAIILGGPMNVYEEEKYPFLKDEDRFIKKAMKLKIPLLGICLGAQLLAKAAGAKVKKAHSKEIGWHTVKLTNEGMVDPLFDSLDRNLEVFQWHEDQFEIPEKAVLLAESHVCPQVFRFNKNIYGLQFHFEINPEMIESWIQAYMDDKQKGSPDVKDMFIKAHKNKDRFLKLTDSIMLNFRRIVDKKLFVH